MIVVWAIFIADLSGYAGIVVFSFWIGELVLWEISLSVLNSCCGFVF